MDSERVKRTMGGAAGQEKSEIRISKFEFKCLNKSSASLPVCMPEAASSASAGITESKGVFI